jgi:UDP-N-acetyl-D-galactosamine dehydrogenase
MCIPVIEKYSGLKWKQDFFVGYSPERINPGDKERTSPRSSRWSRATPRKPCARSPTSTAASSPPASIPASSIKVAEAAKVIENTQRDLNIALMNELAIIFGKIGIDT